MLNEGYHLYKSLERCNIPLPLRHPDIKKPGKKNGLIVGLDKDGKVATIEFRDAQQMTRLWTLRDSKKNSFPAMKLKRRLLNFDTDHESELKKLFEAKEVRNIKAFWSKHGSNSKTMIADWKSVINKIREQDSVRDQIPADGKAYKELLERMKKLSNRESGESEASERRVTGEIVEMIFDSLGKGLIQFDQAKEFLFKEKPETFLFFDVADYAKYDIRVASPDMKPFVSDFLFKVEKSDTEGICALSGESTFLEDDKFPEPDLDKFGPTKIFSMNKDARCHYRYGKISTEILPVSKRVSNCIQASMEWITKAEREKKTWIIVPSGQFEVRNGKKVYKDDLLIVYLENKPNLDANKAHMLGGVSKEAFNESTFDAVSEKVIRVLEEARDVKVNDQVQLFVLRKADKDRRQVVIQRNYTVGEVIASANSWRAAAKNVPPFWLQVEIKEENKSMWLSPRCPFPANLVRLTQIQWLRFGRDFTKVVGISLLQVYDIFFDHENKKKSTTEILLGLTLRRTEPLLVGLGEAIHKGETKDLKPDARFSALLAVSAIGIYLHKLGISKEEYMRNSLFNVGRFLSLVDTLHFEWCRHVRGGYPEEQDEGKWRKSIPPQLLGNAYFRIALDNPATAFARLSERLNIYKAWAQKQQPEDGNWAHGALSEIGRISLKIQDAIDEGKLPSTTTDIEKAQILLGYLAKSEEKSTSDSDATAVEANS